MPVSDFSTLLYNPNIPWGVPIETIPQVAKSPQAMLWTMQRALYYEWWRWFDGRALAELQKGATDSQAYIYPLGINPVEMICHKHAAALFGEVSDDADSMVSFEYRKTDDTIDEACENLSRKISGIWAENNGRGIQQQNALLSQYLGGCVYRVGYDPIGRESKISITSILPDFFLPIYDMSDPWNLIEAYVMYYITAEEAKDRFKIEVQMPTQTRVLYVEHWTKDRYELQVGGQTPNLTIGMADYVTSGRNPFGIVPFVYIPHLRRVGGFYGWSHVPSLIGVTKELNLRLADIGDNVSDNAQAIYWVRNVAYAMKVRRIEDKITAIDLGGSGPSGREPELNRIDVPGTNTMSMDFAHTLWQYIEKMGSVPGVAWGEDEGSQRSALTLSVRMWPFTSHIRDERSQWTVGLRQVNKIILKMLLAKGDSDVNEAMLKMKCKVVWSPIMPRERAEIVEEMVARKGVNLVSTRSGVIELGFPADLKTELSEIEKDIERESKLQQKQPPKPVSAK